MENSNTGPASAALLVGAGGGIGRALVEQLLQDDSVSRVYAVSRQSQLLEDGDGKLCWLNCSHSDADIAAVVKTIADEGAVLSHVVLCTGMLHSHEIQPEKAIERLRRESIEEILRVNTVLPALWLSALV